MDYTRHPLFAFTQWDWRWSITIGIVQVHAHRWSFLFLATNLSLLHFLFQFYSLIFSLLGLSFLKIKILSFFRLIFLFIFYICTCLFFS
jgi:hypothetical protein